MFADELEIEEQRQIEYEKSIDLKAPGAELDDDGE